MINSEKTSPIQTTEVESSSKDTIAESASQTPVKNLHRKTLFNHINSDLKSALDTWEVLTEKVATKVSPEEEQLHEVKRLLQDLKNKISQFENE